LDQDAYNPAQNNPYNVVEQFRTEEENDSHSPGSALNPHLNQGMRQSTSEELVSRGQSGPAADMEMT